MVVHLDCAPYLSIRFRFILYVFHYYISILSIQVLIKHRTKAYTMPSRSLYDKYRNNEPYTKPKWVSYAQGRDANDFVQ